MLVQECLTLSAARLPEKTALVCGDQRFTYRELDAMSDRLGHALVRDGVTRGDRVIELSPREFDLLQVLMQEPGRFFSRTELCELIWRRDHLYGTRTVEIFVTRLRKKVDSGFAVPLIQTLRTVGYTIRPPS